mmetsp:Transcript_6458/g.19153  ORF Transcript_6458/g.19153 Transcript_6458/m.19153 type:complete len:209 (+) Transcript_6458:352-978(+)
MRPARTRLPGPSQLECRLERSASRHKSSEPTLASWLRSGWSSMRARSGSWPPLASSSRGRPSAFGSIPGWALEPLVGQTSAAPTPRLGSGTRTWTRSRRSQLSTSSRSFGFTRTSEVGVIRRCGPKSASSASTCAAISRRPQCSTSGGGTRLPECRMRRPPACSPQVPQSARRSRSLPKRPDGSCTWRLSRGPSLWHGQACLWPECRT